MACSCEGRPDREEEDDGCAAAVAAAAVAWEAVLALSFLLLAGLLLCCWPLSARRAVPASFFSALAACTQPYTHSAAIA